MWKLTMGMIGPALVTVMLTAVFITWEYCAKRWWRRQFRERFWGAQASKARSDHHRASWWRKLFGAASGSALEESGSTDRGAEGCLSLPSYFGQRLSRYGLAILAVALALLVRWLLEPVLKGALPYSFFLAATVVIAWNAGVGETLLAVVLGFLAGSWFFAEPFSSIDLANVDDRWSAGLYLFIGLAIVTFKKSMQIAWLRALNKDIESLERRKQFDQEKTALEETKVKYDLLASAVETAESAILTIAPHGAIMTWNRAAQELLGFSARDAVGGPLRLILPPENNAEERRILEQVNRGDRTERWRTAVQTKTGGSVEVMLSLSPVKDRSGKLVGAVLIAASARAEL